MNSWSLSSQRLVAGSLLLLLIAVLTVLFIQPNVMRYIEYGESIDELEHRLNVYNRLSADLPNARQKLETLLADDSGTDLYFPESRPALAAAQLQQQVNNLVGESGGQLISTQMVRDDRKTPLGVIVLEVHLRAEAEDLTNLLHKIEYGKPLLFVEGLTVSATASAQVRRRSTRQINQQPLPSLDIRFNLVAYTKGGNA